MRIKTGPTRKPNSDFRLAPQFTPLKKSPLILNWTQEPYVRLTGLLLHIKNAPIAGDYYFVGRSIRITVRFTNPTFGGGRKFISIYSFTDYAVSAFTPGLQRLVITVRLNDPTFWRRKKAHLSELRANSTLNRNASVPGIIHIVT
jgi:hypothetical protein